MYTLLSSIDDSGLIRLRRLRRWSIFWMSLYLLAGVLLFFIGVSQATGALILSEILALVLVTVWHLRLLECPQCGGLFYADCKWGRTNPLIPFADNCMHCGFSLAADQ